MTEYPLYVHREVDHVRRMLLTLPYERSEFLQR